MMTMEELKAKYDPQPIEAIEKEAKGARAKERAWHNEFINILRYLEGGRFKENPFYKKTRFEDYLKLEFGLRLKTYTNAKLGLIRCPEFVEEYPVQLPSVIQRKCGAAKLSVVIKEIEAKAAKLKRPIQREQIQVIIDNHAKPVPPSAPKPDVKMLQDKVIFEEEAKKKANKQVESYKEQVFKLKNRDKESQATIAKQEATIAKQEVTITKQEVTIAKQEAENAVLRKENGELREILPLYGRKHKDMPAERLRATTLKPTEREGARH